MLVLSTLLAAEPLSCAFKTTIMSHAGGDFTAGNGTGGESIYGKGGLVY